MLPDYADIKDAIDREPDWFTADGIPRYWPFHPDMLGVYDTMAVLVEIECASCQEAMLVGDGLPTVTLTIPDEPAAMRPVINDVERFVSEWSMGDPPRHYCPGGGGTMVCDEVAVIEVWDRDGAGEWRRPDLEGPIDDPEVA